MTSPVLTIRQPLADLIMAGAKDVENRSWAVPSTVPCTRCNGSGAVASFDGDALDCVCTDDGPFPFRLWVHAAAKSYKGAGVAEAWATLAEAWGFDGSEGGYRIGARAIERVATQGRYGVVLGSVEVTGCHHADECDRAGGDWAQRQAMPADRRYCSRWAEPDAYHWTLAEPRPLATPVPAKGRLGLWTPDDDLTAQLEQAVAA